MPLTADTAPDPIADVLVVGGGISGLALGFRLVEAGISVVLTERDEQVGGTARTTTRGEWCCDWGPNGFLTNVPDTVELATACGLGDELVPASAAAKRRYLWRGGRLVPLPTSPASFAASSLLGIGAKLRVLAEPFARPRDPDVDETIYEFATRRLGREFAENFLRPMVVGITAGDAREVSLDAMFPRMRAMEEEHGSLFRALRAKRREAKARGEQSDGPAGPGARLTTFRSGGVGRLCTVLRDRLGHSVRAGFAVDRIERLDGAWRAWSGNRSADGRAIVLAVPAHAAAALVEGHDETLASQLRSIPYSSVRVLGLGYRAGDVPRDLDGFGFLVPPGEPLRMLGCLWTSSIFPHQAPDGHVLLRMVMGGVFDPEFVALSDPEALAIIRRELTTTLGIEAEPVFVQQVRWPRAIPQYLRGHLAKVADIEARCDGLGIHVIGNAYRGVSLNDCAREATTLAAQLGATTS
jgi:oxygen-dependent protoporphyrinogen oxidase